MNGLSLDVKGLSFDTNGLAFDVIGFGSVSDEDAESWVGCEGGLVEDAGHAVAVGPGVAEGAVMIFVEELGSGLDVSLPAMMVSRMDGR